MDKLRMTSPNLTDANIEALAALFPTVMTETLDAQGALKRAIDFDLLRQELSDHIVEGPQERYRLDWPGKRAAAFAANAPIAKTLRPVREESVDFDTTKNLFIEGDNLDALKLLQESYLGKVKLIYIDPPYNTGNDFIYADDFAETSVKYLAKSEQMASTGERLVANTDSNGRYHSDWLSMMYPRLKLARNLLTEDGYIVVSIDDTEVSALEILLDEVIGVDNKLAVLVWDRNRKNDARFFSVGHEYMLVYARNKAHLTEHGVRLREPQQGIQEARELFARLTSEHGEDWDTIQTSWRKWASSFPVSDERRKLGRFNKVGPHGPFRDDGNINWPGGGGPRYEVLHPVTGKACKIPTSGWRFPNKQRFTEEVANGRIVFGADETTVPRIISHLFNSEGLVMSSVHYSYAQTASTDFMQIMNARVFDNPKNWKDLRRVIEYLTGPDDVILDFFGGSGSTAHAVLDLNATASSNRRFILVQLDETAAEKSSASAAGYNTIADIARDRIRRVESGIADDKAKQGFRSLKVDSTCRADVLRSAEETHQLNLDALESSVKSDRSGEDLLFQVLLDAGLELTMPITREERDGFEIYDVEKGALMMCVGNRTTKKRGGGFSQSLIADLAGRQPLRMVFLDEEFADDAARINAEQIFREVSPHTEVRAL